MKEYGKMSADEQAAEEWEEKMRLMDQGFDPELSREEMGFILEQVEEHPFQGDLFDMQKNAQWGDLCRAAEAFADSFAGGEIGRTVTGPRSTCMAAYVRLTAEHELRLDANRMRAFALILQYADTGLLVCRDGHFTFSFDVMHIWKDSKTDKSHYYTAPEDEELKYQRGGLVLRRCSEAYDSAFAVTTSGCGVYRLSVDEMDSESVSGRIVMDSRNMTSLDPKNIRELCRVFYLADGAVITPTPSGMTMVFEFTKSIYISPELIDLLGMTGGRLYTYEEDGRTRFEFKQPARPRTARSADELLRKPDTEPDDTTEEDAWDYDTDYED